MMLRPRGRNVLGAIAALAALTALWIYFGPLDESLLARANQNSITILDRNGEVLYETLPSSGARTELLTADRLPLRVIDATLAAEDKRFFRHFGVDALAVGRATLHNVKAMRVVEGGSTITQQVAKLLLRSSDRSVRTKIRETVLALRLERRLVKREILALYLNLAPYGNRIHGVARASRTYFGCPPDHLTAAQAAFLASLPQRPSAFNPLRDPRKAVRRQQQILEAMSLTENERVQARAERLQFATDRQPVVAMHFVERVLQQSRGARVETTLDARLQRDIAGIIAAHRPTLLRHGAHSVAVAVLHNRTGEWLAWEGSGDYFGEAFGGAIDGVGTPRQPGSTLKPFTYALAFESGWTPATVLADIPSHFPTAEQGVLYTPRNYDGRHRGPLRIREALAGSQNVPAVAALARFGPESLLRLLRNNGFTGLDRTADYYGLGLTLGDAEVTLEQLVTGYAAFARGGVGVRPAMIRGDGADGRPLVSQRTAFWITDILSDSDAREFSFGAGGSLEFPFPVAVKTGTSQAYHDNWTVGYTREVTVGVWVGNFDREPLRGSSGVTGAAPIFNSVMLAAVKRVRGSLPIGDTVPVVGPPAELEMTSICALSGARPTHYCPATRSEWLPAGDSSSLCTWHHDGEIAWPAEYREWASKQPRKPHASATERADHTGERPDFRISNPPDGATYLIDPTLRMEYQTLRLRAVTNAGVAWQVDGKRVDSEWPLKPGVHTVTAIAANGARDSVKIFVK